MRLDSLDRRILTRLQDGLPLEGRPFRSIARDVGTTEQEVMARVQACQRAGMAGPVGPVLDPAKAGLHTMLVAVAAPESRVARIARTINEYEGVTHNYYRRDTAGAVPYNVWFTLSAASDQALEHTAGEIEARLGLGLLRLPARRRFKIRVRLDLT